MWANIINSGAGLILGLVTGFYFERRASRSTREHSRQLEDELSALRASVYSVGGNPTTALPPAHSSPVGLLEEVRRRAREVQGADGKLSSTQLVSYFFAKGYRIDDINKAIEQLCEEGRARPVGKWLEVM